MTLQSMFYKCMVYHSPTKKNLVAYDAWMNLEYFGDAENKNGISVAEFVLIFEILDIHQIMTLPQYYSWN